MLRAVLFCGLAAVVLAAGVPGPVLCNSKLLAYEFAAKLMPERAGSDLVSSLHKHTS
jgi:hypothetical protein